jgi:hypothetical protein
MPFSPQIASHPAFCPPAWQNAGFATPRGWPLHPNRDSSDGAMPLAVAEFRCQFSRIRNGFELFNSGLLIIAHAFAYSGVETPVPFAGK